MKLVIESTKTNAGTRKLPITEDVTECFRSIFENRESSRFEKVIDGYSGIGENLRRKYRKNAQNSRKNKNCKFLDITLIERKSSHFIGYFFNTIKMQNFNFLLILLDFVQFWLKFAPMGYSGFLFADKDCNLLVAMHWEHRLNHMFKRYNEIYRV